MRDADWSPVVHRARLLLEAGRTQEASSEIERFRQRSPEWAAIVDSEAAMLRDDPKEALSCLGRLTGSPDKDLHSRGYALRACALSEMGRYREAVAELQDGLHEDASFDRATAQAEKLLLLAYIYFRQGHNELCRQACRQAVKLEASPVTVSVAGGLLARSGAVDAARKLLRSMQAWPGVPVFQLARAQLQGEIALAERHPTEAVKWLRDKPWLQEPLARALDQSGDHAGALSVYRDLLQNSRMLVRYSGNSFPGLSRADALFECARLAQVAHEQDSRSLLDRYLKLRGDADPELREVVEKLNQEK